MQWHMREFLDISTIWKQVNSRLTEEEENDLLDWVGSEKGRKEYVQKVHSYFENGPLITNEDIDTAKAKRKVTYELFVRRRLRKFYRVAAIFSAIVVVGLVWQHLGTHNQTSIDVKQIQRGRPRATLVLSDGSRHNLEFETSNDIKDKGHLILNSGKQLDYRTESTSSKKQIKKLTSRFNTLSIPRGGEYFLTLSDGTKVWLNSESILTYPLKFGSNERKVELIGEAFFDVTHDKDKPFRVKVNGQEIEVLGTTFNVNAYADKNEITTTLVSGLIKIDIKDTDEKVILNPGFQFQLNKAERLHSVSKVNTRLATAWLKGYYLFDDATLEEMILTLSRWYDFEFDFKEEQARTLRFSGKLKRTERFEDILTIIENTNEVKFEIIERNVIIY